MQSTSSDHDKAGPSGLAYAAVAADANPTCLDDDSLSWSGPSIDWVDDEQEDDDEDPAYLDFHALALMAKDRRERKEREAVFRSGPRVNWMVRAPLLSQYTAIFLRYFGIARIQRLKNIHFRSTQGLDKEVWGRIADFLDSTDGRRGAVCLHYALAGCDAGRRVLSHFGVMSLKADGDMVVSGRADGVVDM
jgi:hypothetical protein